MCKGLQAPHILGFPERVDESPSPLCRGGWNSSRQETSPRAKGGVSARHTLTSESALGSSTAHPFFF